MAKQSLLTGGRGFGFDGLDFTKYVTGWQDTRGNRNANFEYLKRDGGEGEGMGRAAHVCTVNLCFVGETWREDYREFQAKIDKNKSGNLTHPIFDDMRARSDGVPNASANLEEALNQYEVTCVFREDQVDSSVATEPSASGRKQEVANNNDRYSASYSTKFAASSAQVTSFFTAATTFTAAAESSANNQRRDPSLLSQLESVRKLAVSATSALRADPASRSDATSALAVSLIEQTFDSCAQLFDLSGQQGQSTHVVPAAIHIAKLATDFYGRDGYSRIGEILKNNGIQNPGMIPAGTKLVMAPKTNTG